LSGIVAFSVSCHAGLPRLCRHGLLQKHDAKANHPEAMRAPPRCAWSNRAPAKASLGKYLASCQWQALDSIGRIGVILDSIFLIYLGSSGLAKVGLVARRDNSPRSQVRVSFPAPNSRSCRAACQCLASSWQVLSPHSRNLAVPNDVRIRLIRVNRNVSTFPSMRCSTSSSGI
jgi:hypothetical protein